MLWQACLHSLHSGLGMPWCSTPMPWQGQTSAWGLHACLLGRPLMLHTTAAHPVFPRMAHELSSHRSMRPTRQCSIALKFKLKRARPVLPCVPPMQRAGERILRMPAKDLPPAPRAQGVAWNVCTMCEGSGEQLCPNCLGAAEIYELKIELPGAELLAPRTSS